MTGFDDLRRENKALRSRSSSLYAAIARISASLDLDTVINEVVDSARALTDARYGAITTIDDAGALQDFVASGFSPEEQREMMAWPDGLRLFEHLRDIEGPLRLADFAAWVRSLGYSPKRIPSKTLQATPMRHRGRHLGTFFLGDKMGGQAFTDEDEELLVLFASQAATAIANARVHGDERRARADLEALVETSPVGVAVFDATTGLPMSFNREALRIVDGLRSPDQTPEQLLKEMTCRFPDGREISLSELPMTRVLSAAETVRAEEVEVSIPDGRRATMLVNVTPNRSDDGTVVSAIVTLQDLEPLQDLERYHGEIRWLP